MNEPMKSIYLVNPISGRGHLDSYARLYSQALIELGYNVVLVGETDGDTLAYLTRTCPDLQQSFSFTSFEQARRRDRVAKTSERAAMNAAQLTRLVWRDEGMLGLLMRLVRVPRRILLSHASPGFQDKFTRLERTIGRRLLRSRVSQWLNLAFYLDAGRIFFSTLLEYVHKAAQIPGRSPPDLVIFLYLDLMAEQSRAVAALDRTQAWPWIGILFHPRLARERDARIEGYFKSNNARGGIFLVPAAIQAYAEAIPQLHFALVPDVADLELPTEISKLATDIRKLADGRTIVLQIGSITAHKGIPTLLDVIAAADPSRFFFALVGEVHWESFAEQKKRIQSFYARPPENVYLSQGYVKNERDYNDLIAACDILYAVYQNFDSSSNSLTKAAGLRRPILVSENSLMGDRVRRFNIGSVTPEGDVGGILEGLGRLAERPRDGFGFDAFHAEQSVEALKSALAIALPSWLSTPAKPATSVDRSISTADAQLF
jgi:hypothetical protein